jgi:hypothetical protein
VEFRINTFTSTETAVVGSRLSIFPSAVPDSGTFWALELQQSLALGESLVEAKLGSRLGEIALWADSVGHSTA